MNGPMVTLNDHDLLRERCFIAGEWTGEPVDAVINPAMGGVIGRVPRLGAPETCRAVEAAQAAFGPWSKITAAERAAMLKRWSALMIAHRDALGRLMTSEQGKPLAEAIGEIDYAASFIDFFAEEATRIHGETIPSPWASARIVTIKQPIGVIAAITPWNFPAAMITRKIGPALAAGCTAVVKPAPETPLTALALVRLAERAGIPPGVLNIVTGDAVAIGQVLTEHDAVRLISFTGSTQVGKLLMRQAASTVKKVALELGGNAPFIVFDDADIDAAIEGALIAKFRNMGQTCVCVNRLYVQDGIHDRFVEKLVARVSRLKVGDGATPGVEQGPLISEKAVEKVERLIADAVAKGAKILTGGARTCLGRTFFEPTVLAGMTTDMLVTEEEIFGPVMPVYRFTDEADVVAKANATRYGLASYFYASDISRVLRVAEQLQYGMVGINSGAISTAVAPFGGVKESGLGREGSRHGIEEYLELKYLLLGGIA
jgi:succinate-semialdehyde dehydrogenase / glutarate-semialdehyde dehydrogenase